MHSNIFHVKIDDTIYTIMFSNYDVRSSSTENTSYDAEITYGDVHIKRSFFHVPRWRAALSLIVIALKNDE
jgi:hypothetical protein